MTGRIAAKVNSGGRRRGGRQYWPKCFSAVLASGGIQGWNIYGVSDKHGAAPAENPTSPFDLTATTYHALGIDPSMMAADHLGREPTLNTGTALKALFKIPKYTVLPAGGTSAIVQIAGRHLPEFGDQCGHIAPVPGLQSVIRRSVRSVKFMTYRFLARSRIEPNTTHRPSGDGWG